MKVRIEYTVDVSDDYRRAINLHYGRPGLATRDEVKLVLLGATEVVHQVVVGARPVGDAIRDAASQDPIIAGIVEKLGG